MNKERMFTVMTSVIATVFLVGLATGAFTQSEKRVIKNFRARIIELEERLDGAETDITILDEGMTYLIADEGPLWQIDQNLLMTQDVVFEAHPPIDLTDILAVVDCDETDCTIEVEWSSDPPATGQVEWGETEAYGNLTEMEARPLDFHRQTIGPLPAEDMTYHYRIIATIPDAEVVSEDETITTA